jgi:hypothetical protein
MSIHIWLHAMGAVLVRLLTVLMAFFAIETFPNPISCCFFGDFRDG